MADAARGPVLFASRPPGEPAGGRVFLFDAAGVPELELSRERKLEGSARYSRLYADFVDAAAPFLESRLGLGREAARTLAREALVPLSYFYLDRLTRLGRLLALRPAARPGRAPSGFAYPARMERFRDLARNSPELGQVLLARQGRVFGLEQADEDAPPAPRPAKGLAANRNFTPSSFLQKARRLALIARRRLGARGGPAPALSMGYSTDAFKNEGFYPGLLAPILGRLRVEDGARDAGLREELRAALAALAAPANDFLAAEGLGDPGLREHAAADLASFLAEAWPSSILEAAPGNLARAAELLAPFAPRPLVVGERGDAESILLIAAARGLGRKVVVFQHGGHIGYLADQTVTVELEIHPCDVFVTWGWEEPPKTPPHPARRYAALPNPWLSERARRWRGTAVDGRAKPYDFLLFSNRVHLFPNAPSGAYQLTTDYLGPHGAGLVALAEEVRRTGLKLLHKPYNPAAVELTAGILAEMERRGGESYRCLEASEKGLTPELVAQARIVLWDQPGTGFLECAAAGIPTMCLWPRSCNVEDAVAEKAFADLEAAGVVHREPASLCAEAARASAAGVEAWLAEPARREALARFRRGYARSDDDWAAAWARFLAEL